MMDIETQELTLNAVPNLIGSDAEDEEIVVQIFNISKTKTNRLICFVSDGTFFLKAYLNDDSVVKPSEHENAIVAINSHGALKSSIGIAKVKMIGTYKEKIGNPQDWNKCKENGIPTDNQHTPQKYILDNEKLIRTEKKTIIKKQVLKTGEIKTDQYQKIDDLYIGLKRFTLLCRITRKALKESLKKGTKILEIQLVDKSKKKIMGTFFGECAVEFNDYLKEGSVYEVSKGYIREGNYNNSRNQMLSPYTLVFDAKSNFSEVSDYHIIVKSQDTAVTLGKVFERHIFHQEYDVVAYVCQIKDEASYQRNDKTITVREVVVADPEAEIMMAVKLWRWQQELPNDLIGKVVIFSRFSMKENKDSVYLSSNFNSTIITQHDHPLKKYEGRTVNTEGFRMTSQTMKRMQIEENPADFCWNTKELEKKIEYMSDSETIVSMLNVWITRFAFARKWSYEACPKCKKAAEKYNKCANCDFAVQETDLKFVLGVEISDFSGSMWVTAYDEFAKKIFYDLGKNAATKLHEYNKQQLSEVSEKYAFQFYRIKINTKKDSEGRVKHTAGHLFQPHEQKLASQNIRLINEYLNK